MPHDDGLATTVTTAPADATDDVLAEVPVDQVKELLEEHVPLTLIMDLSAPQGPPSEQILAEEGTPEQQWWAQG